MLAIPEIDPDEPVEEGVLSWALKTMMDKDVAQEYRSLVACHTMYLRIEVMSKAHICLAMRSSSELVAEGVVMRSHKSRKRGDSSGILEPGVDRMSGDVLL